MTTGLLLIDNLIYGTYTLIEDKENQVILEGIYNRASKELIDRYTVYIPGFPVNLAYFDMELLFGGHNQQLLVEKDQIAFQKSIQFKKCIINWPHIKRPEISLNDEPQIVRIPIIFRERFET